MSSEADRAISVNQRLPRVRQWVIIVTPSFRCMGYLDDKGQWRDAVRHQIIDGVKEWYGPSEEETVHFTRENPNASQL